MLANLPSLRMVSPGHLTRTLTKNPSAGHY